MRLAIRHETRYEFDEPVGHGLQRLRLTPKETHGQRIIDWAMSCEGGAIELTYEDQNCNTVTLASLQPGTRAFTVRCEGLVETTDHAGVIGRHAGHMPLWAFQGQTPLTKPGQKMRAILSAAGLSGANLSQGDILPGLHALSTAVVGNVAYEIGHTHVATTAEEAAEAGHGVCQDHAQIFIGLARLLGIPARYASGYLMLDGRIDQEATHAWAEAFVEGLGWVGFDVSNGISPDARYIRVASGRDYREAAPVTGMTYGSAEQSVRVEIQVEQQVVEQ